MPIDTEFKFGHVVAPSSGAVARLSTVPVDPRGLLAGFVGNLPWLRPVRTIPKGGGRAKVSI